jgi:hypothetical protein
MWSQRHSPLALPKPKRTYTLQQSSRRLVIVRRSSYDALTRFHEKDEWILYFGRYTNAITCTQVPYHLSYECDEGSKRKGQKKAFSFAQSPITKNFKRWKESAQCNAMALSNNKTLLPEPQRNSITSEKPKRKSNYPRKREQSTRRLIENCPSICSWWRYSNTVFLNERKNYVLPNPSTNGLHSKQYVYSIEKETILYFHK